MDMGSYIAYKLYPDNLIYMDGRYEEVYFDETKKMLDNFFNMSENWNEILDNEYRPDFIIAPIDAAVNDLLEQRKDYILVWTDERNWVYSDINKMKKIYKRPSNDFYYYIKNAFVHSSI